MVRKVTSVKTETQFPVRFKQYLKSTSGGTGLLVGIAAVPLGIFLGVAFDTVLITREQPAFYQSVDNAALAVAGHPDSKFIAGAADESAREERMKIYARKFLHANYSDIIRGENNTTGEKSIELSVDLDGSSVTIDAELEFPTPFLGVFGPFVGYDKKTTTLKSISKVERGISSTELAMVLDTTGSMKGDMVNLQNAANKLLAKIYDDKNGNKKAQSEFIRVSLVPFAGAVRLDTTGFNFNMGWIDTLGLNPLSHIHFNNPTWNNFTAWGNLRRNNNTAHAWNGCVEARKSNVGGVNYITQDIEASASNPESLFPAYFNPDSPSWVSTSNPSGYDRNNVYRAQSVVNGRYTVNWANNYISTLPIPNNGQTAANNSLLAPTGSNRTGYDDSTIGRNNLNFAARATNVEKYRNRNIGEEVYTQNGNGSWSAPSGPWTNCAASAVVPMTHQREKIEDGIDAMRAYGGTNIAEGLAWGMRTLSPQAPFNLVEGASGIPGEAISPFNGQHWQKVLVLMTDGLNDPYARWQVNGVADQSDAGRVNYTDNGTAYNALGYTNVTTTGNLNRYGSTNFNLADDTLDNYTRDMCTDLKAKGVTIYTVAFRLDSTLMRNCASKPEYYAQATDTSSLELAFERIGQSVKNSMAYLSR